jgi:ferredoxin
VSDTVEVRVRMAATGETHQLEAARGSILRDVLFEHDISPHGRYARRLNCSGRGLCATCGVRFGTGDPDAEHWHDRLADRFGYPRLSCQLDLTEDCAVVIPEKRVWGDREARTE